MIEEVKAELVKSAEPIMNWFTTKGLDFASNLIAAMIILLVGALCIKLMSRALRKAMDHKIGSRQVFVRFCMSVVVKGSWVLLIIVVLSKLGVEVGPMIAGLGVTGFVLGFAFQESLGSLAAGMMLAFNQPFKIGDYVSVCGHEGTIQHLDMMAVVLATGDNRRITIPNKQCWGAPIINFSALELRRVELVVGIAYGENVGKARNVAKESLASIAAVLQDPAPMVEVKSLDDSAVVLICRVWVKNADYWPTFFAGNQLLLEAFAKNNISIPFPQLDVHVQQA